MVVGTPKNVAILCSIKSFLEKAYYFNQPYFLQCSDQLPLWLWLIPCMATCNTNGTVPVPPRKWSYCNVLVKVPLVFQGEEVGGSEYISPPRPLPPKKKKKHAEI